MKYFIAGGAGFIGSNLVRYLLNNFNDIKILVYDNFSSGKEWFLADLISDPRLEVVKRDISDLYMLTQSMEGSDIVIHLASNPDIAKAITEPSIDFWQGTFLTQNILEAMRLNGVKKIIYASGSGIYGNIGYKEAYEDYEPKLPISGYAASKLAGEAMICGYCHMFDMIGRAYRFANVVGPKQTHGIGYDFLRKLKNNPNKLQILGNGEQSKSYVYVDDILDGIFSTESASNKIFDYFNIATGDYITVKEIADIVVEEMGLSNVEYEFTSKETRGWKSDVGIVRFSIDKIKSYGWEPQYSSEQAIRKSVREMLKQEFL